jgi:hypothetical protein
VNGSINHADADSCFLPQFAPYVIGSEDESLVVVTRKIPATGIPINRMVETVGV